MKKIKNFCGIFATLFVTTTIILLASCSQDDDVYDNSEMYTLAEMGTRLGGDPEDENKPVLMIQYYYKSETNVNDPMPVPYIDITHKVSCPIEIWANLQPTSSESNITNLDSGKVPLAKVINKRLADVPIISNRVFFRYDLVYHHYENNELIKDTLKHREFHFDLDTISYPANVPPYIPNI